MLGPVSFSGPIRQLSNKAAPGKRRKATLLPGGKLKPLQKNVILQDESKSSSQALPGIGSAAARNLTEDQVKDVLAGHWDNIPPLPSKQIRIYLSSSPDMWQEREIILKEAVPQLQDYCIQRGFSFHLVDTRWEGPKEIFDDYHAQAMHLSELEKCQKVSVGPNFVILLGDKYGEVPFPHTIPEMDFEALRQAAKENQLPNADLLEKCFIKDINAVPPQYNLKFGFNGHQELDQESCLSDEDFEELQAFFKDTCRLAVKTEKMTRAREQWYFQSVVEKELVNGIVKAPSPENSTLCFRRDFKGVPKKLQQSSAARYFDVEEKFDGIYLNQEKYSAMVKVKSERLTPSYQTDNQKLYTLQWTEMGVDQHNPEHSKYLNQLCSDFVEEVTKLIDKNLTVLKKAQKYYTPVLEEVLHHAHVWKQKCSDFSGREEFLEKVHQQLMDSTSKLPLIIHSLSGEGKSSVVSMIHKNCGQWLGPKCVTITRYLGLMQGSSTVQELVTSLIAQICTVFNLKNMIEIQGSQSSLFKLLKTFHSTLKQVASKNLIGQDRHLVLILDGIDRLTPIEEALRALWVILDLPPFTHVIISTISERGSMNIIDLFKGFIPNESCYLGLPEVPDTEAEAILDANLAKAGRSVSSEQKEAIMQAFRENRNLFLLKLLLDKAKLWKSYTSPEFLLVTPDIDGAVLGGVELLELKHGSQLIKNVVSYITLSGLGVTEQELHDLLSCNDEVMQEVYELYAAPPLEGVVHFPSVLMVRLLHDIEAYLIYREADGHDIIGWSHQLLVENLSKVYGLIYPGILQDEIDETSVDFTLNIHEDFVQLYKAEATVKKTITIQDKTIPDARRLTVPRPLNAKNLRKLRKLPFHMRVLIPANESGRIKEEILCNFQWLLTKFKGTSVKEVLSDFESVLGIMKYLETMSVDETQPKMSAREDVEMIYSSLKAAMQALKLNPENLAAEILGRATAEAQEHPYIGLLMKGAAQWVEAANTPLIIPVCPCFPYKNNSGLQGLMVGPSVFIGVTGVQDNLAVTYNYSEGVELRSLDTGEALSVFPAPLHGVFADNPLANVALSEDGQLVLIKTHPREKTKFTVWSTSFGNKVKEMTFDFQVSSFAISRDAETIVLGTHDGTILGIALHTGEESFSLQGAESSATITNIALDEVSGKIVATGQDLYVWDMPTLTLEHAFLLDGEVKCGLMKICSSSGRVVCGVSSTGTVIVASYNNGQILDTIESRTYRDMRDILIGAEGFYVIIATWNLGVDIWSVEPAQCVKSIDYPEIASDETDSDKDSIDSSLIEYIPSKVAIDHNELFLFVGFEHGEVAMYYIPTGEVVKLLMHGVQSVTNVSLFKEEFLFSSCNDGTIKRWHVKDLMTQTINRYGHSADTFAEQSPLEMHVPSKPNPTESGGGGTGSGEDSFYPTEDEAVREMYTAQAGFVVTVSTKKQQPVKVWDCNAGTYVSSVEHGFKNSPSKVFMDMASLVLMSQGEVVSEVEGIQEVRAWNMSTSPPELVTSKEATVQLHTGALSSTGMRLAAVVLTTDDNPDMVDREIFTGMTLSIWEVEQCIAQTHVKFTAEEIAAGTKPEVMGFTGEQENLVVIQCNSVYEHRAPWVYAFMLIKEEGKLDQITASPFQCPGHIHKLLNDGRILTATATKELILWDVRKQVQCGKLYDPDLVRSTPPSKTGILPPKTPPMPAHIDDITYITVSPDGSHLVSGSHDKAVKLWNLTTGTLVKTFLGHRAKITCLDISEDNQMIASGSSDQTIMLWNLNYNIGGGGLITPLNHFYAHASIVQVKLSQGGKYVVAVVDDKLRKLVFLKLENWEVKED